MAWKQLKSKDSEAVLSYLQALSKKTKLVDRVQLLTQISAAAGFDGALTAALAICFW